MSVALIAACSGGPGSPAPDGLEQAAPTATPGTAHAQLRSRLRALMAASVPGPSTPQAEAAIEQVTGRLLATPRIARALTARWLEHGAPRQRTLASGGAAQVVDVGYSTAAVGFPQPGAQRQSWAPLDTTGTIDLAGLGCDCTDPRLELTPAELVACSMTPGPERTDVVMHVFDTSGYEVAVAECKGDGPCAHVPSAGTYWVTLHGGPGLLGLVSGSIVAGATSAPFELAGTRAIDLQALASSHYDIDTVLQPDPDNTANDGLGADATELWLLDDNFRLIDGDFAQSGVGPAGRRTHAEHVGARYLVVRPWSLTNGLLPAALPDGLPRPAQHQVEGRIGAGRLRIVLNDWYDHDTDHDGLSNAVEGELGLCSGTALYVLNGVVCPRWSQFKAGANLVDPRDTDGDGLTDSAEVLGSDGKDWQCPPGSVGCVGGQQPDANQTLPRWGADPLHKDLFMELDTAPGSDDPHDCPLSGVMSMSVANPRLGQFAPDNLYRFQEIFSKVSAHNPDGQPGIHVHFDIDLGTVNLPGHGAVPGFAPSPTGSYYTPVKTDSLVTFPPQGSTCGAIADVSQLDAHKGYFAWAVITADGLTGGHSGFGGTIHAGADAVTMAHETGHHLGLSHGGPSSQSPYHGPLGDSTPNTKVVQFSPMNYAYQVRDNADVFFPGSEAHMTSPIPSVTGQYREIGADPARDFAFLTNDTLAPTVGGVRSWGFVTASSPGVTRKDLIDFDWDGIAGQGAVAGPVQAPSGWGGAYAAFPTTVLDSIPTMHMVDPAQASCALGNCQVDTMRMAGSPVGVLGAGAIQIVSTTNGQPASAQWTAAGTTFRVAKFQGLGSAGSNVCEFHDDSCATNTGETDLTINGGGHIATAGPWSAGLAALSDGSVAFAWTHGDLPGGAMNSGGAPAWHAPRIAFAPGGDLTKPLNEISLPANPTSNALSVAAWNETDGSPSVVTLIVRQPVTDTLFGAACTQASCSGYAPIVDSAGAVRSSDSPVLITRQRADGKSDLYLLCSNPPGVADPGALKLLRLEPGAGLVWQPVALTGAVPHTVAGSALSATFTSQANGDPADDRFVVVFGSNSARPVQLFASTRPGSLEFVPQWTTAEFSNWAHTRQYDHQTFPGSISTFFRGDPPHVDPSLAGVTHLAMPYRGGWIDNYGGKSGSSGVWFWASGAAGYTPPEWEYAEDSTLAWGVCQALGKLAAPDLVSAAQYPFECPAILPGDIIANQLRPILNQLTCLGGGCRPPPCIQCQLLPAIQDLITQPAWLATVPTASGVYGLPLALQPGAACSTDALFTLPYGFEPIPARVPQ